ncbi:hypothetical protein CKA55_01745 [Arcobacter suis]|uniref:Antitoxin n=1 Tax=Arcobacter suis CECT 7833 TaxID=663365 RepID=A0AAD0SN71_9BACT|nr:hypothetical protein [Arcobacter suis]AXX88614.1 hypothetical protein ASUIS_0096 [Arcobacter suis CECT 7833]RWS47554.1 hypothetical protein CKA55_01745 [Arcobacter suis]
MALLQYTSNEMFSSTELIRKSKNIFDKLNRNEIEKAIVLRDGKPGIILLDFNHYEQIMNEYLLLKNQIPTNKQEIKKEIKSEKIEPIKNIEPIKEDVGHSFPDDENNEFSFDSDLTKDKPEPLKEFWD